MIMQDVNEIIKDILNTPLVKDMTIKEARKKLRDCGILDKNNKIAEAYRSIISDYKHDKQ